jgi:hypothetical protein
MQGVIIAAIYSQNYSQGSPIIIWSAIIASIATMPVQYILGGLFLRKIYATNLNKFDLIKKMKGVFNK